MERVQLSSDLDFSRIIHGLWRLDKWDLTKKETLALIEACMDMGITTFDHADIYGDYSCEELFGDALALKADLRQKMQIVTKCGIKLLSKKRPDHRIKYYDTSKEHIIGSVHQSLRNLRTDYIDVLLIHRPDPFMNPEETAEAFSLLKKEGKVRCFGVSNFLPAQLNMLNSYLDFPLVTNQIEVSVRHLDPFSNGSIDQCLERRMPPMVWSPLAGGKLFSEMDERSIRLRKTLEGIADDLGVESIDRIMFAWLLLHPARMMPIVGSRHPERIQKAVDALDIQLSRQQWFEIWQSSAGRAVD